MERLKEKEWLLVNDIIRDIYAAEDINQMQRVFLLSIRKLIPYKSAVFCMVTPEFRLDLDHSVIVGADTRSLERYNDRYIEEDFTNGIFDFPKSTSYKDEDLIDPEEKKQTRFYREWLLGNDCKYSGGLVLKKGALTGSVNIYRNDFNGPLTERDLFLLEVFMGHLENLLGKLLQQSSSRRLLDYEKIPGFEKLSEREAELFPFVLQGFSNGELAEKFCISESTVKKHIYNILLKFDVNSRGRLIRRCLDESGESGR